MGLIVTLAVWLAGIAYLHFFAETEVETPFGATADKAIATALIVLWPLALAVFGALWLVDRYRQS